MKSSFNKQIKVKLTKYGIRKLMIERPNSFDVYFKENDPKDTITIHLWDFANIFGDDFWMGNNNIPVESLNFEFV
jgi:hypothetical protein